MEVATTKEARALTNQTKAITPRTLREVLSSYATKEYADTHGGGSGSGLVDDVKVNGTSVVTDKIANVSVPTLLSQLTNDSNFVQTVNGFIPQAVLPSYVDDVLEYDSYTLLPNPGERGKIYVTLNNNLTYRWTGSTYVEISQSLALGITHDTAYYGDLGKIAYDHSQIINGNPHGLTLATFSIAVTAQEINYLANLDENIVTALQKKLNLTGGTLTGYLTLHSDPALSMHAATKQYVDNAVYNVGVIVSQQVNHFNNIVDQLNTQESYIGLNTETLVKVENKLDGYSYVQYILKHYEEYTGRFGVAQNYYEYIEGAYIIVTYNSNDKSYTTNDGTVYHEGDVIPSSLHLYIYTGDYEIGDSIEPVTPPDITYKEGETYYSKSGSTYTELDPGVDYIINTQIDDNIYSDNTYEEHSEFTYDRCSHVKYKQGTNYYKENTSMVISQDITYQENKKYYKENSSVYTQLIPGVEYNIGDTISTTVYEISYLGTYTQLVAGTDYTVGDYIDTPVYLYTQHITYNLTTDSTFQQGKTYYYKVLTSGVDIILQTHKDTFTDISQTEDGIIQRVSSVESFIDDNITNDGGLIDQVNKNKGNLDNAFIDIRELFSNDATTSLVIQGLLGADSSLRAGLSTLERATKNIQTDSYIKQEVQTIINGQGYFITRDLTFQRDRDYYVKDQNNNWVLYTSYNIGDIIPENIIYEYGKTKVVASESGKFDDEGLLIAKEEVYDHTYELTTHEKYLPGIHYYILDNGSYVQLLSMHKVPSSDVTFDATKTYYIISNDVYIPYVQSEYKYTEDSTYQEYGYNQTLDSVFVTDKDYYELYDGIYLLLEYDSTEQTYTSADGTVYNVGDSIPVNKQTLERYQKEYYILNNNIWTRIYKKTYELTQDSTFQANKVYYTKEDDKYFIYSSYEVGDTIPANTIYELVSGTYTIGDIIIPETVSELIVNWSDGDTVPQSISLFEETGDYTLGETISSSVYVEKEELTRFISNTIGRYNEKGMSIRRVTDPYNESNNEEILYAGVDENNTSKSVVRTINLEAKEYLYAANKHLRIEEYTANSNVGWAMFYL